MFVTREYVDIEAFDIAPQPERRPQPFGREVFVFVIVISGQLSGILARLHAGGLEPLFALRETAQAIIRRKGQLPEAERADQRGIYLRKVELLPLDIGVHQRRFAVELRITDPGAQIRMRCHELVFASQVKSLAPESWRRTVYSDDLHAVDGLGSDDVLVGAERLPVEVHAHEMPAQCRPQRQGGIGRHLVRFEQVPDNPALARLALPVAVGDVGIERPVLQLDTRPLRILPDGESRNAVGREVYVGAPPLLQRPVEQSPVEECLVQVGTGAHAFRVDLLAVRTHDIDRPYGKASRMVHHAGRKFEIQPRVLVAQVFALGIVAGFELHA